ncbi:MAG: right-handed parallel beta-helix repeat-containing protein [Thermoplasmatales archaeon]|nr:MAG: right-handed parallel beta-helix repeat-containing protein [Thermoplasmatales archaeon]
MRKTLPKNGIAIVIIVLFLGMSVIPSTGTTVEKSYVTPTYTPHDPIYINGNDDFTSENGVTGGSGISNDPYTIENWRINVSFQDGITILNASVYFTIINCYVHDGGINNDGVVFLNVSNGVIEDTIITGNRNGVMFRTQYNGKENSENNIIRYNNITSNTNDGIHFEHTGWDHHNKNIITHNNISGNNRGIYMIMSAYNQIVSNNVISNDEVGIMLDMCEGGGEFNKIHHNNFVNNGENQVFERGGPSNKWDDEYPSGGNYWSDYNGTDGDGDGIGDTPYAIPGGDNEDKYPLMEPWEYENQPPNAPVINGPTHGKVGVNLSYTITVTEFDGDAIWVIINWSDGNFTDWLGPIASGIPFNVHHTWYEEGTYTIKAKAMDKDGESDWGTLEVTMPKNKAINFNFNLLSWLFERYPWMFPILRQMLGLE